MMNSNIIKIVYLFLLLFCFFWTLEPEEYSEFSLDQHTALLLIDIQNFYFEGGKIPLQGSEMASLKAKEVLKFFRENNLLVVHVKHMSESVTHKKDVHDTGWDIHTSVAPQEDEVVFVKHYVNCFRETGLYNFLKQKNINKLIVGGMQTHMCLEAAVRAAADQGFSVTVIHDACATRDLKFNSIQIPAHLVHASTLASLKSTYARILSSDELIAEHAKINK
jgi:nicotinamidase-related amidase